MRLLFVLDSFASGGAQRQMVRLAIGLQRRHHQVEFFIYYPQYTHFRSEVEQNGIPIHEHHKKGRYSPSLFRALLRQMRQGRYDGILSFLTTPNVYTQLAHLQHRQPFLVVSERNIFPDRPGIKTWLIRQMHRIADYVTVNSHFQRQKLVEAAPWLTHKVTTIYNGVDLEQFSPENRWQTIPNQDGRFLAIGSVVPRKKPTFLVESLKILRDKYSCSAQISWAGKVEPAQHSQQVYHRSNEILMQSGLKTAWRWLGERSDVPDLLRSHDALIHAGIQEGLPNVICEALSCGAPALVSNVLEHPRLIKHGVSGFLFDPNDPHDLAAIMKQFIDMSADEKRRMGEAGRAFAVQKLSLSQCVESYEELFAGLIR
jgi:glycosyltransferase involved in cell wall biosynthesis